MCLCIWAIICTAIIKSIAPYPHPLQNLRVVLTPPLTGIEFPLVQHPSCTITESHCFIWHFTVFVVGLPSLNWQYDDIAHLQCPVMTDSRHSARACYNEKSAGCWCCFVWVTLLIYFWNCCVVSDAHWWLIPVVSCICGVS